MADPTRGDEAVWAGRLARSLRTLAAGAKRCGDARHMAAEHAAAALLADYDRFTAARRPSSGDAEILEACRKVAQHRAACYVEVCQALGLVNHAEGQSGYELAPHERVMSEVRRLAAFPESSVPDVQPTIAAAQREARPARQDDPACEPWCGGDVAPMSVAFVEGGRYYDSICCMKVKHCRHPAGAK